VTAHHLLFILMSAIWGVTWIATKAGLGAVPPLFFGAVRYILVSAVLVVAVGKLRETFGGGRATRIVVTGTLVIVATYGLLYWGMLFVPSGVAGVVNMSMNPVFFRRSRFCSARRSRPGGTPRRSHSASPGS